MQSKADPITIARIPRHLIPIIYDRVAAYLKQGAEAAGLTPLAELERLFSEIDQLWVIAQGELILGAFVTTFCREGEGDAEKRFVGVSNLAGAGARRWAPLMCEQMAEFAKANGCAFVRCYGRPEWARILPNIQAIGTADNGHTIFERAA